MKTIKYGQVVKCVKDMCIESAYRLPADVRDALVSALAVETCQRAKSILTQLLENAEKRFLCRMLGAVLVAADRIGETENHGGVLVDQFPDRMAVALFRLFDDLNFVRCTHGGMHPVRL